MINHTEGEQTNHYTTDAARKLDNITDLHYSCIKYT